MKDRKKKGKIRIIAVVVLIALIAVILILSGGDKSIYATSAGSETIYESSYESYLKSNGYGGTLSGRTVEVDLSRYTASQDCEVTVGLEGVMTGDTGQITWEFDVEETGFYNLELGYIALPGTTSDIQRKILIDGGLPYEDLSRVVIKRWWSDEAIKVKNDNEIRPGAYEVYHNTIWYVEDYNRRNNEPLIFFLTAGKHTITFEVTKEPLEYTSLRFTAAPEAGSYTEEIAKLKAQYPVYGGENVICQAERVTDSTKAIYKSSTAINIQKNYSDTLLEPYHPYYIVYNTIGASSWNSPGESITWKVEAPEAGLYELTVKGRQNLNRGVTSYRRLYVNGEVPYREVNSVAFNYSSDMNMYTVTDEAGEPYLFYLNKGENTITLECVMGPMGGIISQIEESLSVLNETYLSVIQLTGQAPNKFIDYEINKKLPSFVTNLEQESKNLYDAIDAIVAITGEKGENTSLLEKMAMEAEWLAEDPESVIEELNQFKNNISAIATWLVNVADMPLEVDSIILSGPDSKLPAAKHGFFKGAANSVVRFFATFFYSTRQITEESVSCDNSIKVWMASFGREQAQIIQNQIDETFTPEHDISVNLQLIPVDVVLRAALAGNGPDVVIGLGQGTLQDFAMRNAVSDLSTLPGYEEVAGRFYKSTLDSASFQGGVYGIPEQANFMMVFARTDILEKLGLEIPQTWTEFVEMIPVLQKNNYNAYIPNVQQNGGYINLFFSMIFQKGGNAYGGEGKDYGIVSALESDEAMEAFKSITDFYTGYGLEVQVDFTNRFRTGEVPIGVITYNTFNQLEIFAPEIKGRWTFAPMIGTEKEDGTIDHSFVVDTVSSVIMAQSKKQAAAWEFVKWWTGTEAQLSFANSLEALMGTAARYSAADPEVLRQLPWSNAELSSLLAQFEATIGIEAVPGNYMTTRMVQYAFNDVVAKNANPRETLYLNIKSINEELTRKRQELHLSYLE
ncbi:MAG: extracellular solute-binding protein [Lachnospiraceae bacterium]|nr:extracellular solute-binding protein [Lachnospiraceae bacterium]